MNITHLLVPTDFSETAAHALRHASEEATVHRARVTLLHVVTPHTETSVYYATPGVGSQGTFDPDASAHLGSPLRAVPSTVIRHDPGEDALMRLQDMIPDAFRGAWDVEVAVGSPAETIVRVARERGADLIVMGTHGRTGLSHVLLGSVAEKVVRLAACPVLTVRHPASAPSS